ncbi:septation ring formation regulator EzrA [Cytobacillus purgationiresistens]|uniref:Septation ring formation regulator EzrA n=1 Tax=Cytobacillus purgationiresistens TaxID=863449 RepID=A0ABU0ALG7_9BACI|nr:septation ring formation regulator EzrA [Cytobacillus purgationiresistens]MDQ0272116.1 septation ring formation regulator [Cytobacillus purgationiresistens]
MEFVIGGIVIVICIYFTGYFFKKKYYKEVDRLETWKMDIMNRPVLNELSKVKQLNMTGQTEELFETWRSGWDEIVTAQLPGVEGSLFDAEEYIDKYRFKKAKEVLVSLDANLNKVEEKIEEILAELNELIGSEEKNRLEMEALNEEFKNYKKRLLTQRHTFGKPGDLIEYQLEEVSNLFETFEDKTSEGNYLEAREIVFSIKSMLDDIQVKLEQIPSLLVECQSKVPAQIVELKDGYKDMLAEGYILDHIQVEQDTEQMETELVKLLEYVHQTKIEEVTGGLDEVKARLDSLYDLLEKEVHARHFIQQEEPAAKDLLFSSSEKHVQLKEEMTLVCESYHVPDKDLEGQGKLEKTLTTLIKKYDLLEHKINSQNIAHTVIKEELTEIKLELEYIKEEQDAFTEKLHALRKDEIIARDKVNELKKKISEMIRIVSKSNVPGLPQEYKYSLQDANESIKNVVDRLAEKPLNIQTVHQYLEIAVMTVEKTVTYTDEMVETILLTEKVIQYGNRYRSAYPSIAEGLNKAEDSFRNYEYKAALEQAAATIEEIEPGALKKIEDLINE